MIEVPDERLARSAGVAGAATLASRLLGLARDQMLAALFGAGNEMDAFIVAFRIPNLVRDLFAFAVELMSDESARVLKRPILGSRR